MGNAKMPLSLRLPRVLAVLFGGLLVLLGAWILLLVFGTPANDPAGAPGPMDMAAGAALVAVPLVLIAVALRTRSVVAAWLCAGATIVILVAGFQLLFV